MCVELKFTSGLNWAVFCKQWSPHRNPHIGGSDSAGVAHSVCQDSARDAADACLAAGLRRSPAAQVRFALSCTPLPVVLACSPGPGREGRALPWVDEAPPNEKLAPSSAQSKVIERQATTASGW